MEEFLMKDLCEKKEPNFLFPHDIQTNNKAESFRNDEKLSKSRTTGFPSTLKTNESCSSSSQCSNINIISKNKKLNINNLKILTKYKNIYVPKIFLIDYNDISIYPPKNSNVENNSTQINSKNLFSFINSNTENSNKDYLNYGYNFQQWKEYAETIRKKFDELNDYVITGKIRLPEPYNELEYLFTLPSDYGGLGSLYNEHKYKNVKFYDPKKPENANKSFMEQAKFERKPKMIWFPLYPNPESLNKKSLPFFMLDKIYKDINTNEKTDSNNENNNNNNDIINDNMDNIEKKDNKENEIDYDEDVSETKKSKMDEEESSRNNETRSSRSGSISGIRSRSRSRSYSSNSNNRKYKKKNYYKGYNNYRNSNYYNYNYNKNKRYYQNNINYYNYNYNRYNKRNYRYKGYYYYNDKYY